MNKHLLAAGVAAFALGLGLTEANARCTAEPTHGLREHAEVTGGRITVQAGSSCGLTIIGIPGALNETKITEAPRSGRADVRGSTVYYIAKAGYKGEDEFTYAHIGTDMYGGAMKITVRRKVTVVP
jgi:hypothetical protein